MKDPLGPERDGDKLIGRKIPNQFNIRETVVMPKEAWDYLDWLHSEGYDVTKWVRKIDANREPEKTYGEYLLERVWVEWCHRYRTGQDRNALTILLQGITTNTLRCWMKAA